uniref:ABC transporter domain-containing protein n=1 Tax=Mucochytrium quahogii TaxID=96639 RepID=A0A7S2SDN1_9STRA|mmetsp:Transcript_4408/g.9719  ORF Transcript_4408/g.9719 Transcript_4408/m.9719 type:complete len:1578 (+) Transcript_4408:85-4818(+)
MAEEKDEAPHADGEDQPLLSGSLKLTVNDSVHVNYLDGFEDASVPDDLLEQLASLRLAFESRLEIPKHEIDSNFWKQRLKFSGAKFQRFLDELGTTGGRIVSRDASSRAKRRLEHGLSRVQVELKKDEKERLTTAHVIDQDMVDALLQLGVDEHFKIINKMIFGDEERLGVDVTFHDISFDVARGKEYLPDWLVGAETVGNQTGRMFCGWAFRLKAFFQRLCSRMPLENDDLHILHPMSGAFRAGELTLVLGPAGKSSLMHAVSGRLKTTKYQAMGGEVKFNGYNMKDVHVPNIATYVSQLDVHLPTLTVRDTLNFSKDCRNREDGLSVLKELNGAGFSENEESIARYMDSRVRIVLALLGLTRSADTIIGNATLKGVSGGEKRRVTLGEMLVVGSKVLLLDEISTGLDAAATFDITKTLQNLCSVFNTTGVVSLLQPPPETFDLFDNVLLLADGRMIYHGPRSEVLQYFTNLGFTCPPAKDTADFLQEVVLEEGGKHYTTPGAKNVPIGSEELEKRFKQTEYYKEMGELIAKRDRPVEEQNNEMSSVLQAAQEYFFTGSKYAKSKGALTKIVLARQWTVLKRNKVFIVARIAQNIIMGLLIGAVAFQLPYEQVYIKVGVLFTMLTFVGFGSAPLLADCIAARDVFYKQSKENFYPAFSYVLADFLNNFPIAVLDSLVLGSIIYFMVGFTLSGSGQHYFIFLLFLISYGVCMGSLIRLFGYTFKTQTQAMAIYVCVVILMLIFSGAVATRNVIPDYFIWLYWLNPTTWAYTSITMNEFYSASYDDPPRTINGQCVAYCGQESNCPQPYPQMTCGAYFLEARGFVTNAAFMWGGLGYIWLWVIMNVGLGTLALIHVHHDEKTSGSGGDIVKHSHHFVSPATGSNVFSKLAGLKDPEPKGEEVEIDYSDVHPVTLSWRNLKYSVEIQVTEEQEGNSGGIGGFGGKGVRGTSRVMKKTVNLDLLQGIDGYAKPGEMTALMGSSGAGKTTLMDVLAGRKTTGVITGEIYVNGAPQNLETFPKICGYVEQFGVHLEKSTVKEAVEFSAALRLGKDSEYTKKFVEEVMDLLELDSIANHLVGDASTGLSFEEIKRLTIGVELVANPSIVFADEPTSGLEARSAMVVMRCLRNVAKTGRTVVATVHQPSTSVFNLFDNLLLLKRGGEVVFFDKLGEGSINLKNYFEQYPGVKPCPASLNPATWMLTDVIGAGVNANHSLVDFAVEYKNSASFDNLVTELENLMPLEWETTEISAEKPEKYMTSFGTQVKYLLKRNFLVYWRTPSFSLIRFTIMAAISLVVGLIFVGSAMRNASEIQSRISVISIIVTVIGNYNVFTIIPFLFSHKALFYRERSSRMYSTWAYSVADNFVEDPYILGQVFMAVVCFYFLAGLVLTPVWVFFYYFFLTWLFAMVMTFLGMFFAAIAPNAATAQVLGTLASQILGLFSGSSILPKFIPDWLIWLYYISPQRWVLEGLITTQFNFLYDPVCIPNGAPLMKASGNATCADGSPLQNIINMNGDQEFFCCSAGNTGMTARDYVLGATFLGGPNGYSYSNMWYDVVFLASVTVACRVGGAFALAKLNYNKR